MPHFLQGPELYPAQGLITHLANRAKSGAAVVSVSAFTAAQAVKHYDMDLDFGHMPDFDMYDTKCQNYLLHLTDTIHYHGSAACACLMWGPPEDYVLQVSSTAGMSVTDGLNGVAGDPTKSFDIADQSSYTFETIPAHKRPAEYTEEELYKIADAYAQKASILRKLDFDMVSLHFAYRMNLPGKMFSPLANNRTDDWNGSLENRMRFPLLVLQKVREAIGPKMILEIQWSFDDLPGGYGIDDSVAFLNEAKKYIDVVQLRANDGVPAHPTSFTPEHEPFLEQAAYIKARVPGLVVAGIAGYFDPEVMDDAIASGKLDMISQARAWISNPDYGKLLQEGRADELVPCLRCNRCHGRALGDPFQSVCAVNPLIGMEHELSHLVRPVMRRKKVTVIGGGPGGMRCALYLADRGHDVVLYEASEQLGGLIWHADHAAFKWTLKEYKDYLIRQVSGRDAITLKLGVEATPEMIEAEGFDAVVAAVGSLPTRPNIPGLSEFDRVWYAPDAFGGAESMGRKVVVIGGGEVGVEVGIQVARSGRSAVVLGRNPRLAANATKIHYREKLDEVWQNEPNFKGVTGVKVTAVTEDGVVYEDAEGVSHTEAADDIVIATGQTACTELALSFYGTAPEFYLVGDCKKPGTIQTVSRQAFAVAHSI